MAISTPEGVTLQLALAGLGSRFAAAVVDVILQGAVAVALFALLVGLPDQLLPGESALIGVAVLSLAIFALLFAYHVLFEVFGAGRTPGKRVAGLAVVRSDGRPVDLPASALRNLVRLADLLPGAYTVGAVAILVTPRNQRLGDLAADTLVVRRPAGRRKRKAREAREAPAPVPAEATAHWDVSGVSAEELAAVRAFLDRRNQLEPDARRRIGAQLASRLEGKVAGAPAGEEPEPFLEGVAAAKAARL